MQTQLITSLDFENIKSTLKFFLKYNTKFTDYDYVGSNINQLIDVLAYNTFINSYNINFAVNELSLDTATVRDNVTSIAQRLGYSPKNYNSASVFANFNISGLGNAEFCSIDPGTILVSENTDIVYKFNNMSTVIAPVNSSGVSNFKNVELLEGDLLSISYIVNVLDTEQRYIIPNELVSKSSISVLVNSDVYNHYDNLINTNSDDLVFYTNYIQDDQLEILFGENVFGRHPNNGDIITISYLVNNGSMSNGITNFSYTGNIKSYYPNNVTGTIVPIDSIQYSTTVSDYGTDLESLASIKFFAPRSYAAQHRSVTNTDYQAIIKEVYPNTKRVTAIGGECLYPPKYGTVKLIIETIDGRLITPNIQTRILQALKKTNILSITPYIENANYVTLKIYPYVLYDTKKLSTTLDILRNKINILITKYAAESSSTEFYGNKLQSDIYNLDKSIISVKLKLVLKQTKSHNTNIKKYSGNFGTKINNKNCSQIKLVSSPFKILNNKNYIRIISDTINNSNIILQQYSGFGDDKNWNILVDSVGNINTELGIYEYVVPTDNSEITIVTIPNDLDVITEDTVIIPEIVTPEIISDIEEYKNIELDNINVESELNIINDNVITDIFLTTIEDIIPNNLNNVC